MIRALLADPRTRPMVRRAVLMMVVVRVRTTPATMKIIGRDLLRTIASYLMRRSNLFRSTLRWELQARLSFVLRLAPAVLSNTSSPAKSHHHRSQHHTQIYRIRSSVVLMTSLMRTMKRFMSSVVRPRSTPRRASISLSVSRDCISSSCHLCR